MGTFSNYYEVLTTETDEERRIQEKINEENDRFENTEECIEHRKIIEDLYKKNHDLFLKRIEAAKEVRPARLRSDWKKIDLNLKKEKEEDSEELKDAIEAVNNLSNYEQRILCATCFSDVPFCDEKMVDDETLNEFHHIMVQTALDYIREKGLTDVYSVSFYADSLQESAAHGQWCPATDSFLTLESLNKEEYVTRDGKEIKLPYRTVIGKSY